MHLREHGDATTDELQSELYARCTDHYRAERAMWQSTGQRYLEDVLGVDKTGRAEWAYAGDDAVRGALEDAEHE